MRLRRERIDFSLREERARKITRRRAKQLREAVQVGNCGIQMAAEWEPRPTALYFRPEQLAIDRQLVLPLADIKLIDLEAAIVKGRSQHHAVGLPGAPGKIR